MQKHPFTVQPQSEKVHFKRAVNALQERSESSLWERGPLICGEKTDAIKDAPLDVSLWHGT